MARKKTKREGGGAAVPAPPAGSPVAVIELGTSAIRLAIAEWTGKGEPVTLESLQRGVALGKDTFTKGYIEQETTEACVRVLRDFRRVLDEYRIGDDGGLIAVATSAVREAANRDAVLDRIYIGTGIDVQAIDEAEVNRYTFLAVRAAFNAMPALRRGDTLAFEVGAGSTELLPFHDGQMSTSHTHRLGALRLRERLAEDGLSHARQAEVMRTQIERSIALLRNQMEMEKITHLLALGGDARFAASLLLPEWEPRKGGTLDVGALSKLAEETLRMTTDRTVSRFHLSYPEAETLGPALLICEQLARALKAPCLHVGNTTLRDGLLAELVSGGRWAEDFKREIVNSARELGRKFRFEQDHAEYVADVATRLFRALQAEHQLSPRYELLLNVAALLHDVGLFISNRSHHKHSMYVIGNSEIFGIGRRDLMLVSLVARYHRRAMPRPTHTTYAMLDRRDRITVQKLAAILRVADALGRGGLTRSRRPEIRVEPEQIELRLSHAGDLTMEEQALREKAQMFERVYGMKVVLRRS